MSRTRYQCSAHLCALLVTHRDEADLVCAALQRGDVDEADDRATAGQCSPAVCALVRWAREGGDPPDVLDDVTEALHDDRDAARAAIDRALDPWRAAVLADAVAPFGRFCEALTGVLDVLAQVCAGYRPTYGIDRQETDLRTLGLWETYEERYAQAYARRAYRRRRRETRCPFADVHSGRDQCDRCGYRARFTVLGADASLRSSVVEETVRDAAGVLAGYGTGAPSWPDLRAAGWRSRTETYPRLLRAEPIVAQMWWGGDTVGAWSQILASCAGDSRALVAAVQCARAAGVRFPAPTRERRDDGLPPARETVEGRRWTF